MEKEEVFFINPKTVVLAIAIMITVIFSLWYQASRYDKGSNNGISRFQAASGNDSLARTILVTRGSKREKALLLYINELKKAGYHTAALTWLKFGEESRFQHANDPEKTIF